MQVSDISTHTGRVIKEARKEKRFTQEQLAEQVGIGTRHLMAIENEGKTPSFDVLYRLIHALDISADRIFRPEKSRAHIRKEQFINEFHSCNEQEKRIIMETLRVLMRELRETHKNNPNT